VSICFNGAAFFDLFLKTEQAGKVLFDGETGKFPLNDPGKPDQRADIEEADGEEGFAGIESAEAGLFELALNDGEALIRVRDGRRIIVKGFDERAIIICADLLGDEESARFENAVDFFSAEGAMAVEDKIEGFVSERERTVGLCFPEIDAAGKQSIAA